MRAADAPDLDERPRCAACGRRLGRTEAAAGTCLPCQRIAKANAEAVTA